MLSCFIFAYLGPETLLPMTSIVATVAGVVLMCGRGIFQFVARVFRVVVSRTVRKKAPARPHILNAARVRAETTSTSTHY